MNIGPKSFNLSNNSVYVIIEMVPSTGFSQHNYKVIGATHDLETAKKYGGTNRVIKGPVPLFDSLPTFCDPSPSQPIIFPKPNNPDIFPPKIEINPPFNPFGPFQPHKPSYDFGLPQQPLQPHKPEFDFGLPKISIQPPNPYQQLNHFHSDNDNNQMDLI